MSLSTHVLDLAKGLPAAGLRVVLESMSAGQWSQVAEATTDANGRCNDLLPETSEPRDEAIYRLRFETGAYYATHQQPSLYPYIDVVFTLVDQRHHHIPLLLAANGYTTYRGS